MELLLLLTYTAICIFIFKVFKLPLNKWTVPTAGLGGVILIGVLVLVMNYNHPFSNMARGKADLERAQITFEAGIDGENPEVTRIRAELEKARYDVERTIIRAPTSGYVSQLLLRPGMMAASLPLRPVMVFVHDEKAPMLAAFRQNSALRLKAGYEAEIVFPGIPGRVLYISTFSIPFYGLNQTWPT